MGGVDEGQQGAHQRDHGGIVVHDPLGKFLLTPRGPIAPELLGEVAGIDAHGTGCGAKSVHCTGLFALVAVVAQELVQ